MEEERQTFRISSVCVDILPLGRGSVARTHPHALAWAPQGLPRKDDRMEMGGRGAV